MSPRPGLTALLPGLMSLLAPSPAPAETVGGWRERVDWPPALELSHVLLQTSFYTDHFSPDPDHNNDQELIGIELHNPDRWLAGGARFINSHHQESFYLYVGREFSFWQPTEKFEIRSKLSAGLLHGYRGEHRDSIPFNRYGTAPAALPSIGARWGPLEADLIVFGTAGLMVIGGIRF